MYVDEGGRVVMVGLWVIRFVWRSLGVGMGVLGWSIVYLEVWVGGQLHFGQGYVLYANTYYINPDIRALLWWGTLQWRKIPILVNQK